MRHHTVTSRRSGKLDTDLGGDPRERGEDRPVGRDAQTVRLGGALVLELSGQDDAVDARRRARREDPVGERGHAVRELVQVAEERGIDGDEEVGAVVRGDRVAVDAVGALPEGAPRQDAGEDVEEQRRPNPLGPPVGRSMPATASAALVVSRPSASGPKVGGISRPA
jgi:hypothetical protein